MICFDLTFFHSRNEFHANLPFSEIASRRSAAKLKPAASAKLFASRTAKLKTCGFQRWGRLRRICPFSRLRQQLGASRISLAQRISLAEGKFHSRSEFHLTLLFSEIASRRSAVKLKPAASAKLFASRTVKLKTCGFQHCRAAAPHLIQRQGYAGCAVPGPRCGR